VLPKRDRFDQVYQVEEINPLFETRRIAERLRFHGDEMEGSWNGEAKICPNLATPALLLNGGEGSIGGQH
jgi:hypothetical protein